MCSTLRLLAVLLAFTAFLPALSLAADLKITAIEILDEGSIDEDSDGTASIDVSKGTCGVSPSTTEEPFHDSIARITLVNNGSLPVYLKSLSYLVRNAYATGSSVRTKRLAFFGSTLVEADGEPHQALGLFLDVQDSGKSYAGKSIAIPATLGFRNVTFTVRAKNAANRNVSVSGRTALSFDDFDRCGN